MELIISVYTIGNPSSLRMRLVGESVMLERGAARMGDGRV